MLIWHLNIYQASFHNFKITTYTWYFSYSSVSPIEDMAYRSDGHFSLPSTVSYLPNNLSCLGNLVVSNCKHKTSRIQFCYISLIHLQWFVMIQSTVKFNEVNISNYSSGESSKVSLNAKTAVFQASLVDVHGETFLVVTSSDGTHIYMNNGLELKFFLPIGVSTSEDSSGKLLSEISLARCIIVLSFTPIHLPHAYHFSPIRRTTLCLWYCLQSRGLHFHRHLQWQHHGYPDPRRDRGGYQLSLHTAHQRLPSSEHGSFLGYHCMW